MNVQPKLIKLMHVFVKVYQKVFFFSATAKAKKMYWWTNHCIFVAPLQLHEAQQQ